MEAWKAVEGRKIGQMERDMHGECSVMLGNVPTGDYGVWKLPVVVVDPLLA